MAIVLTANSQPHVEGDCDSLGQVCERGPLSFTTPQGVREHGTLAPWS